MQHILEELEERRDTGPGGRRGAAHRLPARQGQADRPRTHRPAARRGLVRGVRHVRRAPQPRLRHGGAAHPRRRGGHRLGDHQRPRGLRLLQGFHRLRRFAFRGPRREDRQGAGAWRHATARRSSASSTPAARASRKGSTALAGYADIFLQNVLSSGRHPADQRDHGSLRRRRRLFAGDHRLHLHGEGHQPTCTSPARTW